MLACVEAGLPTATFQGRDAQAKMAKSSPDWIKNQFLDYFRDSLAEAIDDSDFDFEGHLFASGMTDIAGIVSENNQWRDVTVRGIISGVLADSVEFRDDELDAWATNAFEFAIINYKHPTFSSLFANAKNYDIILSDMIEINYDYRDLRSVMVEETGVRLPERFFSDLPSEEVVEELVPLSRGAIVTSLMKLANDLQQTPLDNYVTPRRAVPPAAKIERAPSYRNIKGAILFRSKDERLEIVKNGSGTDKNPYAPIVSRSVGLIKEYNVARRIGNRDPILLRLLNEYFEAFDEDDNEQRALLLFCVGMDIEARLTYNQKSAPDDERLDDDLGQILSSFIVANGVYVQNYETVQNMATEIERSRRTFQKISELSIASPGDLLSHLVEARAKIYDERTGSLVARIASKVQETEEPSTGLVALELGTLRGTFRAMAGSILSFIYKNFKGEAEKIGSDLIRKKIREIIQSALSQNGLVKWSIIFFEQYQSKILSISDSLPGYFAWLRYLIDLLKTR